jgi:hypothetical protein
MDSDTGKESLTVGLQPTYFESTFRFILWAVAVAGSKHVMQARPDRGLNIIKYTHNNSQNLVRFEFDIR